MKSCKAIITRSVVVVATLFMTAHAVSSANPKSVRGVVQTGGTSSSQPLPNVHVTLFEATPALPTTVGQATTDTVGRFTISYKKSKSSSIFFLKADIGEGVEFVTILGSDLPQSTTINELTTVAASYSMAQFYRTGVILGNSFGLQIAAGMNDNIVASATGQSSPVLLNSPNADETNSLRSTRSLANLLAACVDDPAVTASLFDLTTSPGGLPPHNTAEALANLARDPGQNVAALYALTLLSDLYAPPLVTMPDAWTVTVKVNDSGDDNILFGGPGNLAFDQRGYAWVTNNVPQGQTTSSRYVMALKPNGKPADGRNGTPVSPLTGGGILGTGFGVTIDPRGSVWFGNFGWGECAGCDPSPDGNGSLSRFTLSGAAVSQPNGYQGGPVRAQGLGADAHGNIWISSYGNDSVYVFLRGNPHQSVGFQQYGGSGPFDVAIAANGSAWVSNSGGMLGGHPSSVAKFALANGVLERQFTRFLGDTLKAISIDSHGNAWVASEGDNLVYALRPDGTEIGHFSGGGMDGPWGMAVDGENNVWVSNFGPLDPLTLPFIGRLTKLSGVNPRPGGNVGDPISPPTGYTVPSAGSEVLLHNGDPLYGPGAPPSFIPMMRQTEVVIDQAGNIWSINNWKPDVDIDFLVNPSGDGIVIFVGLAAPPTDQVH
jgi:streptogramin lyase